MVKYFFIFIWICNYKGTQGFCMDRHCCPSGNPPGKPTVVGLPQKWGNPLVWGLLTQNSTELDELSWISSFFGSRPWRPFNFQVGLGQSSNFDINFFQLGLFSSSKRSTFFKSTQGKVEKTWTLYNGHFLPLLWSKLQICELTYHPEKIFWYNWNQLIQNIFEKV